MRGSRVGIMLLMQELDLTIWHVFDKFLIPSNTELAKNSFKTSLPITSSTTAHFVHRLLTLSAITTLTAGSM